MKKSSWESILFLVVGLLAGFHGAYDLLNLNRQDASFWWIIWSLFRLLVGLMVLILGFQGILRSRKN